MGDPQTTLGNRALQTAAYSIFPNYRKTSELQKNDEGRQKDSLGMSKKKNNRNKALSWALKEA